MLDELNSSCCFRCVKARHFTFLIQHVQLPFGQHVLKLAILFIHIWGYCYSGRWFWRRHYCIGVSVRWTLITCSPRLINPMLLVRYTEGSLLPFLQPMISAVSLKKATPVLALQEAIPRMLQTASLGLPCRKMCNAITDTCGCGEAATFGEVINCYNHSKFLERCITII